MDNIKTKKRKKKLFYKSDLYSLMIIVFAIILTMAVFTSSDIVDNRFSAATLDITLIEDEYNRLTEDEKTNLEPNDVIAKDPKIKNSDKTDAFVFLKITVPVMEVNNVKSDGDHPDNTEYAKFPQEVFYLKTNNDNTVTATDFNDAPKSAGDIGYWVELDSYEEGKDYKSDTRTYVFGYSVYLKPEEFTETLFDYVQFKNYITYQIFNGTKLTINVDAYAIQADYLDGISKQNDDGSKKIQSKDELTNILSNIISPP